MPSEFHLKEKVTAFLASKNAPKILFIIGIAAILLIFASSFFEKKEETVPQINQQASEEDYKEELKAEVSSIVTAICGDVSPVVTITLESSTVYEYVDETRQSSDSRDTGSENSREQTAAKIRDSNGGESPLIITEKKPSVRGVAVICNSTEDQSEKIKAAVKAALDITSSKIYIGRKLSQ